MKTAFLFSGQGAQYAGMGRELYDNFGCARAVFDAADAALGFSISALCFEGGEDLSITEYTQPAILTMSAACLAVAREHGLRADYLAGLSLGEYTALYAAGAFDFEAAVGLVRSRGRYMSESTPPGFGAMSAVLGMDKATVQEVCQAVNREDPTGAEAVYAANYNAPDQIAIAGSEGAVARAETLLTERGMKRSIRLSVSAPFHTPFLAGAGAKMEALLRETAIGALNLPVVANVTADLYPEGGDVTGLLVQQVTSPVRWDETVARLIALGVDTVVELGPGRALCGFVKKVSRDITILNIEDMKSLEKTLATLAVGKGAD